MSRRSHFSICYRPRLITALQDCVVKIGRMRFARIERDDHALVLEIDFYILHAVNFHERPAQFSHSLMVTLPFGGDFDGFQDRVIGAFRKKRISWIRISRSCRVHGFYFTYLTCDSRVVAVPYKLRLINIWRQPNVAGPG